MGDNDYIFEETIAANSVQGKLKLVAVKGVPIPLVIPQWSIDRADDETFARPIILKTGRRYRIQLRLILTARSAFEPPWGAKAWFSNELDNLPTELLNEFIEPGFLQWENITIKLNEDT